MYIKQIIIKNYRNLKEINLYNLQNLLILIGENGSGKTNVLEALDLFFNHFDHTPEQNKGPLTPENWYMWFDGNTSEAIEFEVVFGSLSSEQTKKLVEVSNVKQQRGDLTIKRSIVVVNNNMLHRNDLITWGSVVIKRSDSGYSIENELGFEPNSFMQIIIENVLKDAFTYLPLSRGPELKTPHGSVLEPSIRNELVKKGEDVSPKGMKEWNRVRRLYKEREWTPGQLECRGSRLLIPRGETPIPYELEGVGYQALFNILSQTEKKGPIIAIEEPENHLHPKLQKTFVKAIKEIFGNTKQIILSTHSPFILDLVNLSSIWFVYKDDIEGKAQNVPSLEGINTVLEQLGITPSDLLLANGILIVEGITDKDVYTDWARKIGEPLEAASIITIDAEGAGNIKKYLLSEAVQRTCIKAYALCDANSEDTVRKAVKGLVPDENIFCLKKGDIEDYYPREVVLEFAKEWGKIQKQKEEEIPNEIKEGETVQSLRTLLKGHKDWWKRNLAEKVIKEMKPEQIDKEIKTTLTKIYDSIY